MNKKTMQAGLLSISLVALAILAYIVFSKPAEFRGAAYGEPFPPAPAIDLHRADGNPFHLNSLKGSIVLLFFGYTSCPDVCPTTLAELNLAMQGIGAGADKVQVVFISVDPERDTPEKIQDYVSHFNPAFIGLSGSAQDLQEIWDAYGIYRELEQSESALGYIVNHTARVNLIDKNGNLRLSYGFNTPVEDIVHDLKLLLK